MLKVPDRSVNVNESKPRLLVVSHVNPLSRRSGQEQRVYYTLVALRKLFHVTFVSFAEAKELKSTRADLLGICDEVELMPSAYTRSLASRWWHRMLGWVYQRRTGLKFSNYLIGRVELNVKKLSSVVKEKQYDLALFEYFHAADSASWLKSKGVPCVLDMHNILWQSFARHLEPGESQREAEDIAVARYRGAEEAAWSVFDALIAISAGERDYVSRKLRDTQLLIYTPMGIPLEDWECSWSPAKPVRVAYYGGLGTPHNALDALYCYERIMPRIWQEVPDAELWLIGSHPTEQLRSLAERDSRVIVTGYVEHVQDVLRTVSVLLCPFTGTYGFRSRVVEAMALGVPVVASPDAVYGMDFATDRGLFIASDVDGMANTAVKLILDVSYALTHSKEARVQIEELYSFESTYAELARKLLRYVSNPD